MPRTTEPTVDLERLAAAESVATRPMAKPRETELAESNPVAASEIFGDDEPIVSVEAAIAVAEEIVASADGDEQVVADTVRAKLLPILHRLPTTDFDLAVKAVARLLPIGVGALRKAVADHHHTVEFLMDATEPEPSGGRKPSQADLLFEIARQRYDLLCGEDGEPYAFSSLLNWLCEELQVKWRDLYPPNYVKDLPRFIKTRNEMFHSHEVIDGELVLRETKRLRAVFERLVLRALGWGDLSHTTPSDLAVPLDERL